MQRKYNEGHRKEHQLKELEMRKEEEKVKEGQKNKWVKGKEIQR